MVGSVWCELRIMYSNMSKRIARGRFHRRWSHQSIEADAAYSFRIRLGLSLIHMDMSRYTHL
jgi:hypothetical protein